VLLQTQARQGIKPRRLARPETLGKQGSGSRTRRRTHHGLAALAALYAQQRLLVCSRNARLASLRRLSALRFAQRLAHRSDASYSDQPGLLRSVNPAVCPYAALTARLTYALQASIR